MNEEKCKVCSEGASIEELRKRLQSLVGKPVTDISVDEGYGFMIEFDGRIQARFPIVVLFERTIQ